MTVKTPIEVRFISRVSRGADASSCWLWTGYVDDYGYGLIKNEHRKTAQRIIEAEDALWECVKLSGADTSDGRPRVGTGDWPQLPELAMREVRQLRDDYDEALREVPLATGAVQPSREDEPLDSLISPIWRHVHEARAERDAAEAERDALRTERDQWQNEAQQGYEIVEALRVENTRLREELAESVRALEAELDEAQGKLAVSLANPCATCQRRADRAEARVRQLTEALEQIASAERPSRTRGMPAHKLRQFARAALTEPPAGEEKP